MSFKDLRSFIDHLEANGELKRVSYSVDPHLEMTEIADRVLRAGGPALGPAGRAAPDPRAVHRAA